MRLQFKHQQYQADAVAAVTAVFTGQPRSEGLSYRIDPGRAKDGTTPAVEHDGLANTEMRLPQQVLLDSLREVQRKNGIDPSEAFVGSPACPEGLNLDIEMETGTGKTYVYIKTIMELHKQYGWSKFVVVVPSVAIREGVKKTFDVTAEHFQQDYGTTPRTFIFDSSKLHEVESFSSGSGVRVMIINVQAFNSTSAANRRILDVLDEFQSRRPMDVLAANRPILILDEPQKLSAAKTQKSLARFNPLMVLRYSATHKVNHNPVYRLDAVDAYNQKLVKRIGVRGIQVRGLAGTTAHLYLESIDLRQGSAPSARVEIDVKSRAGNISRKTVKVAKGDNLFDLSGSLEAYRDMLVTDIDAGRDVVTFENGTEVSQGDLAGNDTSEEHKRRLQIREVVRAHLDRERTLFDRGVKVLSLFFIDEVVKYRDYDREDTLGDYARVFEEEYAFARDRVLEELDVDISPAYRAYLERDEPRAVHEGYFSVDKKGRMVDGDVHKTGDEKGQSKDTAAYDLILKKKEELLSLSQPVRFIFSHSALREGWDNPNVFTLGMLKRSDNTVSRRQEIGRGLRLAVNQQGERMDDPATVHEINFLTVVTDESYTDFVNALQKEIREEVKWRPSKADATTFIGKRLPQVDGDGHVKFDSRMSQHLYNHLVRSGYLDDDGFVTESFKDDLAHGTVARPTSEVLLPIVDLAWEPLVEVLYQPSVGIVDERQMRRLPLNERNFQKKEFQEMWSRISRKGVYQVDFDSDELIRAAVAHLNSKLQVPALRYTVTAGELANLHGTAELDAGTAFRTTEVREAQEQASVESQVRYDLLQEIAERTQLTRRTIASILTQISPQTFGLFRRNPEAFITGAANLINEKKATAVIQHLTYSLLEDSHDASMFTANNTSEDFRRAGEPLRKHIYDYAVTDSEVEKRFLADLEASEAVEVYAKLPGGFTIPTPVGDYNPDWAIAFKEGQVQHVFFVAETKGDLSSMRLREGESSKIESAKKFFAALNVSAESAVQYDAVTSYAELMDIVTGK